ncbi:MAG: hypothetical protein V1898_00320 [Patescibacteria group bacterium]
MKKISLFTLLIIATIAFTGCNDNKNAGIANIPFAILDKNDFTLEDVAKVIESPMILATDQADTLATAYSQIRENGDAITIDSEKEIAILVFRGKNGNCKNADINITKISREGKTVKVEVALDENKVKDDLCRILMNPYSIVKLDKETLKYYSGLKFELIDASNQKTLSTKKINQIPGILK